MGKYEEALERARAGKPMDEVFPELKGSEDERIRKGLVHFILYKAGNLLDEETEHKFIAYLERQKEQKPINDSIRGKIISRATSEKQVVLISESSGKAEIGWDTRSLEDAKKLLEYGLAFLNKNGVKPAEWSEEDKKFIKHCAELLDGLGEPMCAIRLESLLARSLWKPSDEHPEGGCSEKPNDLLSEQEPTCKDYTHFADVGKMEQPEVDLEKEIDRLWDSLYDELEGPHNKFEIYARCAHHFYELGLNARKEK